MENTECLPSESAQQQEYVFRMKLEKCLEPHNGALHYFQEMLLWEKPIHFGVLFVTLQVLFWFLATTTLRYISILGVAALLGYLVILALNQPFFKVSDDRYDAEMNALIDRICDLRLMCLHYKAELEKKKNENHTKFAAFVVGFWVTFIVIANIFPGLFVLWTLVMALLFTPAIVAQELHKKGMAVAKTYACQIWALVEPQLKETWGKIMALFHKKSDAAPAPAAPAPAPVAEPVAEPTPEAAPVKEEEEVTTELTQLPVPVPEPEPEPEPVEEAPAASPAPETPAQAEEESEAPAEKPASE